MTLRITAICICETATADRRTNCERNGTNAGYEKIYETPACVHNNWNDEDDCLHTLRKLSYKIFEWVKRKRTFGFLRPCINKWTYIKPSLEMGSENIDDDVVISNSYMYVQIENNTNQDDQGAKTERRQTFAPLRASPILVCNNVGNTLQGLLKIRSDLTLGVSNYSSGCWA
jgi:hypothetical protein